MKDIIIIGAGPGGLSAAMLLAHKNNKVKIFEKNSYIGGRNSELSLGEYRFDLGPTFFLMKQILEEIFAETGRRLEDYVHLAHLNPMYRLKFSKDKTFYPRDYTDKEEMLSEIEKIFPGCSEGYLKYIEEEGKKFSKLEPCLKVPYNSYLDYFKPNFLKAIPYLDAFSSVYDVMGRYYSSEELKLAFTFQAKYIGMSPWVAPGTFTMISYLEHRFGIYHVIGGLNKLSAAMAAVFQEMGGELNLNSEVKKIIFEGKKAVGIELTDGSRHYADKIIINEDFAMAMHSLVPEELRFKYSDKKILNKKYSCSTFMIYLGLDKIYEDHPHHNIIFADNYRKNVDNINDLKDIGEDFSFYIQNPSITDTSLAPEKHSVLYILVPVANNKSKIDWVQKKDSFTESVLDKVEKIGEFHNLKEHIREIKVITPQDWEEKYGIFLGATFNLAHNIGQMLAMRPHNKLEGYKNLYIVGGGTHPGSGLPTIYESGRITAKLIEEESYE